MRIMTHAEVRTHAEQFFVFEVLKMGVVASEAKVAPLERMPLTDRIAPCGVRSLSRKMSVMLEPNITITYHLRRVPPNL